MRYYLQSNLLYFGWFVELVKFEEVVFGLSPEDVALLINVVSKIAVVLAHVSLLESYSHLGIAEGYRLHLHSSFYH
jgi:hypothetical protein